MPQLLVWIAFRWCVTSLMSRTTRRRGMASSALAAVCHAFLTTGLALQGTGRARFGLLCVSTAR